ncbi:hypothetical protein EsH8_X_000071 [Colletotrichum jinshuiense]
MPKQKGDLEQYVIEHVLEGQAFQRWLSVEGDDSRGVRDLCRALKAGGWMGYTSNPDDSSLPKVHPLDWVVQQAYPSATYHQHEFISVIEPVNWQKEKAFHYSGLLQEEKYLEDESNWTEGEKLDMNLRVLKFTVVVFKYLSNTEIRGLYQQQANRVGDKLDEMEDHMVRNNG